MSIGRRRLIGSVLGAIATFITGALGIPLAGYFALPALRRSERRWLEVGPVSDFSEKQIQKVLAKPLIAQVWPHETPAVAMYVLNQGNEFTLFHTESTLGHSQKKQQNSFGK